MNDNIKKLYEDASLTDGPSGSRYSLPDEFVVKFAQLIVRECIDIADEYDGVGSTIVGRIQKHFGVEE